MTRLAFLTFLKIRESSVTSQKRGSVISVMLAVDDTPAAVNWYKQGLGAVELWNMGEVADLEIEGAPFFLAQPARNAWETPAKLGITSAGMEVFCDDPDALITRALQAGAKGSLDTLRNHRMPWGTHRQGGFTDPFGHIWLVGDKSPLALSPAVESGHVADVHLGLSSFAWLFPKQPRLWLLAVRHFGCYSHVSECGCGRSSMAE